jgi:hypothetical protein
MRTYQGGCHCGAVRYEADADLASGTLRCNCSICAKARAWLIAVKPEALRVKVGAEELTEYQFGARRIRHFFCRHCGVRPFSRAAGDAGQGFVAVHIGSLEGVPDEELATAPITYVDGRHDDFRSPPAETRHL